MVACPSRIDAVALDWKLGGKGAPIFDCNHLECRFCNDELVKQREKEWVVT